MWRDSGPLRLTEFGGVEENRYAWSKFANIVYWEAPAGVGFSECDERVVDDDVYAIQAGQVLCALAVKYPQWIRWFLGGESYGGVYVALAAQASRKCLGEKLEGLVVSNGCTGTEIGPCAVAGRATRTLKMLERTRIVSSNATKDVLRDCSDTLDDLASSRALEGPCANSVRKASAEAGALYTYNVGVECENGETLADFACGHTLERPKRRAWACPSRYKRRACDNETRCACADNTLSDFLNRVDVRSALGVPIEIRRTTIRYRRTAKDVVSTYKMLVDSGIRLLVVAGGLDGQVPAEATAEWVSDLGYDTIRRGNIRQDDKVIGTKVEYDAPGQLIFATIDEAGHAVAKWQPEAMFELLAHFTKREYQVKKKSG